MSSDSCIYSLHFPSTPPPQGRGRSQDAAVTAKALAAKVLFAVDALSQDYIWQRELRFSLTPSNSTSLNSDMILEGSCKLGESIQDEWYIVYLLLKISKDFPEAVIEVRDGDDGQFCLIEAADVLPKWLTPGNAENRFWIHNGQFHLVPLQYTSPVPMALQDDPEVDADGYISAKDATTHVRNPSTDTTCPQPVLSAISTRLHGYPDTLRIEHSHTTIAYLPDEIIALLNGNPRLISLAVAAFYERDPLQLKSVQFMSRFSPFPAPIPDLYSAAPAPSIQSKSKGSGCHLESVRMTRALYAQIMSQKFYPPKPFLKAEWFEGFAEGSKERRYREVGMKIACGFEMLYQQSSNRGKSARVDTGRNAGGMTTKDRMKSQEPYLNYMVALSDAGYFKGETPGSKLYTELELKANEYWEEVLKMDRQDDSKYPSERSFSALCDGLVEKAKEERSGTGKPMAHIAQQPVQNELHEDPDDWLYLSQAGLEDMFKDSAAKPTHAPDVAPEDAMFGTSRTGEMDEDGDEDEDEKLANEQAKKLQDIADRFGRFVEGEGDVEGALFEDDDMDNDLDMLDDDDDDEQDDEEHVAGPSVSGKRKRDMPMSESEKQERMANLVDPLEENEWGAAVAQKAKELNISKTPATSTSSEGKKVELRFEEKYDGVSDDEDGDSDDEMGSKAQLARPAPDLSLEHAREEIEDDAQVVDDEGLQFGPGEMEDFLQFTRKALGLSEEQFGDIVKTRKERGAFVPGANAASSASGSSITSRPTRSTDAVHSPRVAEKPQAKPAKSATKVSNGPAPTSAKLQGKSETRNPRLDNFEALMSAMDEELARAKGGPPFHATSVAKARETKKPSRKTLSGVVIDDVSSGSDTDGSADDEDGDTFADLDAEVAALLKRDPEDADLMGSTNGTDGDSSMDYRLMSNFLESFKAQAGLPGPVSNMFGRLDKDFRMPRDER